MPILVSHPEIHGAVGSYVWKVLCVSSSPTSWPIEGFIWWVPTILLRQICYLKRRLFSYSVLSWVEPQIQPACIVHPWILILLSIPTKNKLSSSFQVFGGTDWVPIRVVPLLASVPSMTGAYMPWLPNSLPLWKGSHLSISFLTSSTETPPSPSPILHLRVKRANQMYGREWPRRNHLESRVPMGWFEQWDSKAHIPLRGADDWQGESCFG